MPRVPPWKHAAYLLAWPGMDAGASAGGGYGGPTAFFALQSGAVLFERSAPGQRLGLGHGWRGWSFTMLALAVPVYWLFHPPFVEAVIVPFMRAVSAI